MMNQVVLVGEFSRVFKDDVHENAWMMAIKVDDDIFNVKVWDGIADILKEKNVGTLVAVKGKLYKTRQARSDKTGIQAERVSIIDENAN